MPFRGHDSEHAEHLRDPIARFFALDAALEASRGVLGDRAPQRLAAVGLVLVPGDPEEIATQLRAIAKQFQERLPWLMKLSLAPQLQLLFAAILLRHQDSADALVDEVDRVHKIMRGLGMRRDPVYEFIAVLAMRTLGGGAPITEAQVERMRDIYEAMKGHHWILTGPEDFPACALLTTRDGTPKQLAQRAHDIYAALRATGCWPGDPLQTASNLMAMIKVPTVELSDRYQALVQGFKQAGLEIGGDEYDEIAISCFVARPVAAIVETVSEYTRQLREHSKWYEGDHAFGYAVNLAFVRLIGDDPELGPIADVKALLDMYSILLQRGS